MLDFEIFPPEICSYGFFSTERSGKKRKMNATEAPVGLNINNLACIQQYAGAQGPNQIFIPQFSQMQQQAIPQPTTLHPISQAYPFQQVIATPQLPAVTAVSQPQYATGMK